MNEIVDRVERRRMDSSEHTFQDTIDRVVANKWLGIPIFALVSWVVFSISQSWLGPWLADLFVGWIDAFYELVESVLGENVHPVLSSLLLDGIIGGVGAVVGFLPLIMVLFFMLALLEDSGYMARVALVMDPYFKKIGLSGKSIIPMIVSTGCAIPGVMATRTIKNERQRRTTAYYSFMPRSEASDHRLLPRVLRGVTVGTSMYFLGSRDHPRRPDHPKITGDTSKSYFIMELPEYRISIKGNDIDAEPAKVFIIKAGTIILISNAVVHMLQTFNWRFQVVGTSAPETTSRKHRYPDGLAVHSSWLRIRHPQPQRSPSSPRERRRNLPSRSQSRISSMSKSSP